MHMKGSVMCQFSQSGMTKDSECMKPFDTPGTPQAKMLPRPAVTGSFLSAYSLLVMRMSE
jgi:hypothetical protein